MRLQADGRRAALRRHAFQALSAVDAAAWDTDTGTVTLGGFNRLLGVRLEGWTHGAARLSLDVDDRHLNATGILHGGVGASLLDTAMGLGAAYRGTGRDRARCVTLALNTQFLAPVSPGGLSVVSRRVGGGASTVFMEADLYDAAGTVCLRGQGTFHIRPGGVGGSD